VLSLELVKSICLYCSKIKLTERVLAEFTEWFFPAILEVGIGIGERLAHGVLAGLVAND
jgi:hypothetical protein